MAFATLSCGRDVGSVLLSTWLRQVVGQFCAPTPLMTRVARADEVFAELSVIIKVDISVEVDIEPFTTERSRSTFVAETALEG